MLMILELPYRLFSSDVRLLACRVCPDPFQAGVCAKRLVSAGGRRYWLCAERLSIFLSKDGGSLAGVSCVEGGTDR